MPSNQYGLSHVDISGHISAVSITGITDVRFSSNLSEVVQSTDGSLDPRFAAAMTQVSRIRFRTNDIRGALDVAGFNGMDISGDAGLSDTLQFNFKKRAPGGTFVGEEGFVIGMVAGILIPIQCRVSHGQIAEIEMEAIPVYDGVNVPFILELAAASTVGNTPTRLWTVGPWYINGVLLEGIRDFTINFGLDVELLEADGMPWPSRVAIKQRRPSFECSTYHLDQVDKDTLAMIGQARGAGVVTRAFLRRKLEGGANTADGTIGHIRFDVAEGRISMQDLGSGHPESAMCRIGVTPTKTGSTDSIAVNTNVVIGTGA